MDYSNFETFPLQIIGINATDHNTKITAINDFIVDDMAYNGDENLTAILPYFAFWFFCQDSAIIVFAETGESVQSKKFYVPSITKQIQNWNLGVEKLRVVCGITESKIKEYSNLSTPYALDEIFEDILFRNDIEINRNYLSKRSLL